MNSEGGAISINGDETFTLSWEGSVIDGPTVPVDAFDNYQRIGTEPAGDAASWIDKTMHSRWQPRIRWRGTLGTYISEFSDATGSGNFIYEFVEIHVASGPADNPAPPAPVTFDQVRPIFQSFCGGCHTGNGSGDSILVDPSMRRMDSQLSSYYQSGATKGEASYTRILDGSMPLGGPFGGTDEDIALILQWIEEVSWDRSPLILRRPMRSPHSRGPTSPGSLPTIHPLQKFSWRFL